jgi:hypothetical protein
MLKDECPDVVRVLSTFRPDLIVIAYKLIVIAYKLIVIAYKLIAIAYKLIVIACDGPETHA